ncbi:MULTISPECIES: DUF2336 domain-containing protein [Stappiaceae]|jgi:hypothetical protein|uniref:DUF2336 domain-containing protein n=1 Tax=Roseibium aggregatum TaxID=187304 RepID=A0A0M6Y7B6_9HYPH|nr:MULTISPECIES: DUF2336 domain-containing protein [Stappiaceae]MCR9280248.1 DUF2336 domain-containing protein [Paracoccaceae bacterium]MEC9417895.1 DUF2336 domain-containing protein [Pseudomonadota bacterium]AMN54222.1 hypothetical protein ACP90_19370 [Labrenzia sp. CP4]ERP98859.1 hypothetical protein Q669_00955 [Labrenzia sp. C1B10]ERS00872.1 hypothetical protein Q675_08690 [Labrenzia sp. C1B70]
MSDSLLKLARDSSSEKKHELAEHVTGLLVARADDPGSEETHLLNNMLEGVYDSLAHDAKRKMSERLADVPSMSSKLAAAMASDDLPVAQAVLERSKSLREEDLRKIAETKDQGYLLALAKRDHVSNDISNILIKRGSRDVKHTLAANLGAEITMPVFESLVKDMPKQLGDRIRHLRKSNEELLEDLFRDDGEVAAGAELVKKQSKISPKAWLMGIRLGKTTLNKAVYQLAQEHNLLDAVALLSFFSGLDMKYVHNLMVRFDSTGIATVCRATGIGAMEFQAVCKERCKHLKFPESTGSKWLTNYHMLDDTDARRLLALMKIRLKAAKHEKAA